MSNLNNTDIVPLCYSSITSLLSYLTKLSRKGGYIFRGFSQQKEMLPNIIRYSDLSMYESQLLDEFEKYGSHYFVASAPIDFLSYGQHYGLPTRLLDFTYNPFIALSFALFEQKHDHYIDDDRDYYYIRYCKLEDNIILKVLPENKQLRFRGYEPNSIARNCTEYLADYSNFMSDLSADDSSSYLSGLLDCYSNSCTSESSEESLAKLRDKILRKTVCFIDPNQSNQRIIMQQGLFMLPYTLNSDDHLDICQSNLRTIKIDKELRPVLLKYLDTLGYNTFRLMPDLPSICSAIRKKYTE